MQTDNTVLSMMSKALKEDINVSQTLDTWLSGPWAVDVLLLGAWMYERGLECAMRDKSLKGD